MHESNTELKNGKKKARRRSTLPGALPMVEEHAWMEAGLKAEPKKTELRCISSTHSAQRSGVVRSTPEFVTSL